jgi:hypothetical protein
MKEGTDKGRQKPIFFKIKFKIKNTARCQCCGYGMFISDRDFFHPGSRFQQEKEKEKKVKEFHPI